MYDVSGVDDSTIYGKVTIYYNKYLYDNMQFANIYKVSGGYTIYDSAWRVTKQEVEVVQDGGCISGDFFADTYEAVISNSKKSWSCSTGWDSQDTIATWAPDVTSLYANYYLTVTRQSSWYLTIPVNYFN